MGNDKDTSREGQVCDIHRNLGDKARLGTLVADAWLLGYDIHLLADGGFLLRCSIDMDAQNYRGQSAESSLDNLRDLDSFLATERKRIERNTREDYFRVAAEMDRLAIKRGAS